MGNIGEERVLVSVVEDVYGWPGGQGRLGRTRGPG